MPEIDKWREPHGSMAGPLAIKSDYVQDVERLMQELGADDTSRLQSLNRMTIGDLCRLSEFLDGLATTLRLVKAEVEGRVARHPL